MSTVRNGMRLALAAALAAAASAAGARDPQWVFNHGPDAPLVGVGQGVTFEALGLFRIFANGTDLTLTVPYEREDAFRAEERPFFAVRYRIRSSVRHGGLFFVTDSLPSLSDRSYSSFSVTPDGEWHNLVLDMRTRKPDLWKGMVHGFRLDPTNPSEPGDRDEVSRLGFFPSREAAEAFLAEADDREDYSREVVLPGKRCRALVPGGALSPGWREEDFLLAGGEPPAGDGALTVVRGGEVVPTYVNSRGFVFYVAEKPGRYALARLADGARLRRPDAAEMQALGCAASARAKPPSHFARERLRIGAWGLIPDGAGWSREAVRDFAECGFDFLVANSKDSGYGDRLLAACDEEGIEVVLNVGQPKDAASDLGSEFADHPSLGGFYLIDEPGSDSFARYGEMARACARKTGKRPFINLLPMYANAAQLKFGAQAAEIEYYDKDPSLYRKYCEAYCDRIDADYICTDIYPLHIRQGRATSYRDYVESVNVIASVARERGREFWCCIQTFAWNPHVRTPNAAEFRWQCYTLLSFGCRAILCWHYPGSALWPSLVTFRGERTAAWHDARRALNEVKALSDVYCAYRNVGAFTHRCTDKTPYLKMTGELRSFAAIRSVKCDSPLLFGCFEAKSGRGSAFTVVNMSDLESGRSALARLDVAGGRVTVYGRGAPQEARRGADGLVEIPLECGEGVFVTVDGAPAPGASTSFAAAESVWPAGLDKAMNARIAFRAAFDAKAGDAPVLKMAAWYSYRVTLNGQFVGFGPARGPKGFFRADEWDLSKAIRPGRNELLVEVAGYNVPNFYLMEQPPFFKAEVVCGGRVLAATRRAGGGFAASEDLSHVRRTPRYSYQRTFAEAYRLPAAASPALALAAAPEPKLIPRRAPYPDFELSPRMALLSLSKVRVDEARAVETPRALSLPGRDGAFKGYRLDELEVNPSHLAQRIVKSGRRAATDAERRSDALPLAAGESATFDRGLNDTGFPVLHVEVAKPGRLVLQFDEVLSAKGEVDGVFRVKDCNAIVWDFAKPGVYDVAAFEPYTMRYVELDVLSGAMRVTPGFRSYKNPTARRAAFRASDPALVKIFGAARESFRQNAVDVFMDCPGRERAGWNCDAFFTAPVSTLLTGDSALERVFEENLALPPAFDDIPDGALPMCYPSDHRKGSFIPNWGMWFVLETEEYLRRTGDRATVDLLRPRLEKFVKFLWRYRNSDGLLEKLPSWVFVEWSHSNKLVQDVSYPSNMTWADALDAMSRMYGRADLADEARRVRETIRRQSWTGKWFCDNAVRQKDGSLRLSGECTETCQYYAFFHRVATPESHPALWNTLLADFGPQRYDPKDRAKLLKHPEIWPSNAFIGNYLRLKLLERAGLGRQILNETKGYFLYMADRTGTLWENDSPSASCNHGFASYVAVLLVHSVLGIEVDHRTKTVTARPTDVDLDFCGVTLPVPGGELVYDWKVVDGRRETTFRAPPGWRLR